MLSRSAGGDTAGKSSQVSGDGMAGLLSCFSLRMMSSRTGSCVPHPFDLVSGFF